MWINGETGFTYVYLLSTTQNYQMNMEWTWNVTNTAGLLQANIYLEESLNENSFYAI